MVEKRDLQETADNDFVALFKILSEYDVSKNNVDSLCCYTPPHKYVVKNPVLASAAMDDFEKTLNSSPPIFIDHGCLCYGGTKTLINNILKTKEECRTDCPWFFFLFPCLILCYKPVFPTCLLEQSVDVKAKVISLIGTYKQIDAEIEDSRKHVGCCYDPIKIDTVITKEVAKLFLLDEVAFYMKRMTQSDKIIRKSNEIEDWNLAYKQRVIDQTKLAGDISTRLIRLWQGDGRNDTGFKLIKGQDFTQNFLIADAVNEGDLRTRILANHRDLYGETDSCIPANLTFIVDAIMESMNIYNWSCRLKEVDSTMKHKGEKVFDLFGMKFVALERSQFMTLAKAMNLSKSFIKNDKIQSIKIKYQCQKTSYLDFKMVVVLNMPSSPIVEIQILPIQNFVSDAIIDGHSMYKDGDQRTASSSSSDATDSRGGPKHMSMDR